MRAIVWVLKGTAWFVMVNPHVWPVDNATVGNLGDQWLYIPFVTIMNMNFLRLFQSWYLVAILLMGIYLIFMNASPHGRAQAKEGLVRLLVGMVLVGQSPVIMQWLLETANYLGERVLLVALPSGDIADAAATLAASGHGGIKLFCIMFCYFFIGLFACFVAAIRFFVVTFMASIFPLALFLYFFDLQIPVLNEFISFKGFGGSLFKFTILVLLTQIMMVFFLAVALILLANPVGGVSGPLYDFLLLTASFAGICFAPMAAMQLLAWVGAVGHVYSSRPSMAGTRFASTLLSTYSLSSAIDASSRQYYIGHNLGDYGAGTSSGPGGAHRTFMHGTPGGGGMFSEYSSSAREHGIRAGGGARIHPGSAAFGAGRAGGAAGGLGAPLMDVGAGVSLGRVGGTAIMGEGTAEVLRTPQGGTVTMEETGEVPVPAAPDAVLMGDGLSISGGTVTGGGGEARHSSYAKKGMGRHSVAADSSMDRGSITTTPAGSMVRGAVQESDAGTTIVNASSGPPLAGIGTGWGAPMGPAGQAAAGGGRASRPKDTARSGAALGKPMTRANFAPSSPPHPPGAGGSYGIPGVGGGSGAVGVGPSSGGGVGASALGRGPARPRRTASTGAPASRKDEATGGPASPGSYAVTEDNFLDADAVTSGGLAASGLSGSSQEIVDSQARRDSVSGDFSVVDTHQKLIEAADAGVRDLEAGVRKLNASGSADKNSAQTMIKNQRLLQNARRDADKSFSEWMRWQKEVDEAVRKDQENERSLRRLERIDSRRLTNEQRRQARRLMRERQAFNKKYFAEMERGSKMFRQYKSDQSVLVKSLHSTGHLPNAFMSRPREMPRFHRRFTYTGAARNSTLILGSSGREAEGVEEAPVEGAFTAEDSVSGTPSSGGILDIFRRKSRPFVVGDDVRESVLNNLRENNLDIHADSGLQHVVSECARPEIKRENLEVVTAALKTSGRWGEVQASARNNGVSVERELENQGYMITPPKIRAVRWSRDEDGISPNTLAYYSPGLDEMVVNRSHYGNVDTSREEFESLVGALRAGTLKHEYVHAMQRDRATGDFAGKSWEFMAQPSVITSIPTTESRMLYAKVVTAHTEGSAEFLSTTEQQKQALLDLDEKVRTGRELSEEEKRRVSGGTFEDGTPSLGLYNNPYTFAHLNILKKEEALRKYYLEKGVDEQVAFARARHLARIYALDRVPGAPRNLPSGAEEMDLDVTRGVGADLADSRRRLGEEEVDLKKILDHPSFLASNPDNAVYRRKLVADDFTVSKMNMDLTAYELEDAKFQLEFAEMNADPSSEWVEKAAENASKKDERLSHWSSRVADAQVMWAGEFGDEKDISENYSLIYNSHNR